MASTVLMLGLVLAATVTDLRRHKIYNWTTYPGILAAVGLSSIRSLLAATTGATEAQLWFLARLPVEESILGLLLCGFLMLVCYVMLGSGGGDVKLIAMLGAFLGPYQGLEAMLWTFVLGGCMGLIVLIWRVGPVRLVVQVGQQLLWALRLRRWRSPLPEEHAHRTLFLAPCALAAVVIVQFRLL